MIYKASIKIEEDKIIKLMFKIPIESAADEIKVKTFLECLKRERIDVDHMLIRFIRNKVTNEMVGIGWLE